MSSESTNCQTGGISIVQVSSADGAFGRISIKRYYDTLQGNQPIRDEVFHKEFDQEPIAIYDLNGKDMMYDGKADVVCVGEQLPGQQPKCFNRRNDRSERKDLFDLADNLLREAKQRFSDAL